VRRRVGGKSEIRNSKSEIKRRIRATLYISMSCQHNGRERHHSSVVIPSGAPEKCLPGANGGLPISVN
jgi:hypothetical protein